MRFSDVKGYTTDSNYQPMISLGDLEHQIASWQEHYDLDLCPDFQRGHVWDEFRQTAFVEHLIRGGRGAEIIRFNCPGWMGNFEGPMQLVDGLQRLTACRLFLSGDLEAFGHVLPEYDDRIPDRISLLFNVNNLPGRADVLNWYLELNSGGIVHTEAELDRVRALLKDQT